MLCIKNWCDSLQGVHQTPTGHQFRVLYQQLRNFPMFDELWSEIQDAPGEIFDVIDYKEEWEKDDKFDVESYIKGNTDY